MEVRKLVTAFEMRYNVGGMATPRSTDVVSKTMAVLTRDLLTLICKVSEISKYDKPKHAHGSSPPQYTCQALHVYITQILFVTWSSWSARERFLAIPDLPLDRLHTCTKRECHPLLGKIEN